MPETANPVTNSERRTQAAFEDVRLSIGCFETSPPLRQIGRTIMSQMFLLFVSAVLLVAIFWELCKINGQLKRSTPQISEGGQPNDADTTKTLG